MEARVQELYAAQGQYCMVAEHVSDVVLVPC